MKLYHGSNVEVRTPIIKSNLRALDFGAGFYLTSDVDQARKWARSVARRRGGDAVLNVYDFEMSDTLDVLTFTSADEDWLDFVVANRRGENAMKSADIVIGPVANDSTIEVINDYMVGRFSRKIAIELLKPQNLTDQYAVLSEKAVRYLTFDGSEKS